RPFLSTPRIKHTIILDDPFPDPPHLRIPSASPPPTDEMLKSIRIGEDEDITPDLPPEEAERLERAQEAAARALTLEMIGDLPFAEIKPPENVLFVCKLNPVTRDEDLEIIFSRFGTILSCEIVREKKTGESLCYAFIEFDEKESCEQAYFKMDNVLIDDRRIHVDFSQSVSRLHKDFLALEFSERSNSQTNPLPLYPQPGYGGSASLEKRRRYRGEQAPGDDDYDLVFEHERRGSETDSRRAPKRPRGEDADEEDEGPRRRDPPEKRDRDNGASRRDRGDRDRDRRDRDRGERDRGEREGDRYRSERGGDREGDRYRGERGGDREGDRYRGERGGDRDRSERDRGDRTDRPRSERDRGDHERSDRDRSRDRNQSDRSGRDRRG
ncbi:hypothetical protein BDK51DRAFT_22907, partial [Blyttiomyces helicus]